LNSGGGEIVAELSQQLFVSFRTSQAMGIVVGAQHAMNSSPVLHRSVKFPRQSPLALELELQRTVLVGIDGGSAQACFESLYWREGEPCGQSGTLGIHSVGPGCDVDIDQLRLRRKRHPRPEPGC